MHHVEKDHPQSLFVVALFLEEMSQIFKAKYRGFFDDSPIIEGLRGEELEEEVGEEEEELLVKVVFIGLLHQVKDRVVEANLEDHFHFVVLTHQIGENPHCVFQELLVPRGFQYFRESHNHIGGQEIPLELLVDRDFDEKQREDEQIPLLAQ